MKLDLFQLLVGEPVRLRYVKRFSTCRVLHPESVAEHSYYVAFYAMLIADWAIGEGLRDVDMERLLRRSLLHDTEEARTGDMPRFFKHHDERLRREIERSAVAAFREVVRESVDEKEAAILEQHWQNAKDDTVEGRILAFADFLSVLAYVVEEMRNSNRTMRAHLISMRDYFTSFQKKEFAFLAPLVEQAGNILQREVDL